MSRAKPHPTEPSTLAVGLYKPRAAAGTNRAKPPCSRGTPCSLSAAAPAAPGAATGRTAPEHGDCERRGSGAERGQPADLRPPGAAPCPDTCCRAGARRPGHRLGLRGGGGTGPGSARRPRPPRRAAAEPPAHPPGPSPRSAACPVPHRSAPPPGPAAAPREAPGAPEAAPRPDALPRQSRGGPAGAADGARPPSRLGQGRGGGSSGPEVNGGAGALPPRDVIGAGREGRGARGGAVPQYCAPESAGREAAVERLRRCDTTGR